MIYTLLVREMPLDALRYLNLKTLETICPTILNEKMYLVDKLVRIRVSCNA